MRQYINRMIEELTYEYGEFPNERTLKALQFWQSMKEIYEMFNYDY